MLAFLMLFADEEKQPTTPGWGFFLPMIAIFVALYFIVLRPQQKREQAARLAMMNSLKKNDKVVTYSGIIGIIATVSETEDEVTLKVDESSNVRLKVLKSAIARIYNPQELDKDKTDDKVKEESITNKR